jgi:DNA-directed RNA polymerase specialized sigma24 family protein
LHFSRNDRATAEDLVQETFLKLLLSWDSLRDLDDVEPLLYSYLKYSHLTQQRRCRNYSFQSLATIDYDTLAIRLSDSRLDDRMELQEELRRIVSFLLWRKTSARYASVFLLRFFHGFFPDEITLICCNSRHAIDLSMRHAREELRAHLKDPGKKVIQPISPSEFEARHAALSKNDFVDHLRSWIFSACEGKCITADELRTQYGSSAQIQIRTDVLSHIVSCESCLERVSKAVGIPPPSARSSGSSLGTSPRTGRSKKIQAITEDDGLDRVMARARRRLRDAREHHPSALMLAVNGQVTAVRDLSSQWAELRLEIPSVQVFDLIEVMSDQGLPLATFPILSIPPDSDPEERCEVLLSEDRVLNLQVSFTLRGTLIQIVYQDPHFAAETITQAPEMTQVADASDESSSQQPAELTRLLEESHDVRSRLNVLSTFLPANGVAYKNLYVNGLYRFR